jgi:hypothetical protein
LLAYGFDHSGDERYTLKFLDLENKQYLRAYPIKDFREACFNILISCLLRNEEGVKDPDDNLIDFLIDDVHFDDLVLEKDVADVDQIEIY